MDDDEYEIVQLPTLQQVPSISDGNVQVFNLFGNLQAVDLDPPEYIPQNPRAIDYTQQEQQELHSRCKSVAVTLQDIRNEANAFENKHQNRVVHIKDSIVVQEWN